MPRKRRSDAKLFGLPETVQAEIFERLEAGESYKVVREWLALPEVMGGQEVDVAESTLSEFWRARKTDQWMHSIRLASKTAQQVAALEMDDAAVTDSIKKGIHQVTLDYLMEAGSADVKGLKSLVASVIKLKDQEIREKKIELEARKFAETVKDRIEVGLDALYSEISGNAEAEALFEKLKAVVIDKVEEVA